MMAQGSGSLVFIGSGAFIGTPNMPAYATAKAGVLGFTRSTAYALARCASRSQSPAGKAAIDDEVDAGAETGGGA
jgi:NAD(P)-dependent dehydrogenase (short-subunit alcohol dehydrogenase family)